MITQKRPTFDELEQRWREHNHEYNEEFTQNIYDAHIAIAEQFPFLYDKYGFPKEDY